jgi:hypothetical protein
VVEIRLPPLIPHDIGVAFGCFHKERIGSPGTSVSFLGC